MPWSREEASKNLPDLTVASCSYKLPHLRVGAADQNPDCSCDAVLDSRFCKCAGLSNRWSKDCASNSKRRVHKKPLIGYCRSGDSTLSVAEQCKIMTNYCADNDYYLKLLFTDYGHPGVGLQAAMEALSEADGLIAADLNRFVVHHDDRQRDLKPFVHHFFCATTKHLISVAEGVDTGSSVGQSNAMEVLSHVKEFG